MLYPPLYITNDETTDTHWALINPCEDPYIWWRQYTDGRGHRCEVWAITHEPRVPGVVDGVVTHMPAGFARGYHATKTVFIIERIEVLPARRGAKLGTLLLRAALEHLPPDMHVVLKALAYAEPDVQDRRKQSLRLQAWYERHGFALMTAVERQQFRINQTLATENGHDLIMLKRVSEGRKRKR